MKNAERKKSPLLANLGDLNRPLRVRPVRYMGREWWAIDAEDTWPGMVMDLRRLGFESMALEHEVLVREGTPAYETQMDGPEIPGGLKPFPIVQPTIRVRTEAQLSGYSYYDQFYNQFDDESDSDEEDDDGIRVFSDLDEDDASL